MNLIEVPNEILYMVDMYLDFVGRDTLASTCKTLHNNLSVMPKKEVLPFYFKNGIYYLKGRALDSNIYFTKREIKHHPRNAAERFLYGNDGKKVKYILYEGDNDLGYFPNCITKEEFYSFKESYDKEEKKKEERRIKEEEEEKKKQFVFPIKGSSKITNPWKKI